MSVFEKLKNSLKETIIYKRRNKTMTKVNDSLEYKMPKKFFDSIVATRSGEDKKMHPYNYVKKVINEEFGFKGTVTRIIIE